MSPEPQLNFAGRRWAPRPSNHVECTSTPSTDRIHGSGTVELGGGAERADTGARIATIGMLPGIGVRRGVELGEGAGHQAAKEIANHNAPDPSMRLLQGNQAAKSKGRSDRWKNSRLREAATRTNRSVESSSSRRM